MDADDLLLALAEQQHGFATRDAARTLGLSKSALAHRLRAGGWEPHGRRVIRRAGAPWTKASPLMRAVLDAGPGAVVSGASGAAWWGLPGFDLRRLDITRPRGLTGARTTYAHALHEVLDLTYDQVTVLDGIPIVRPERLLFELCASVHPERAERALDTALSKRLCSVASVRRIHTQLAERGRAGTVLLRNLLEIREADGWVPPESNLEARFATIMREAGIGPWRRQVDLGDDAWCGRVDYLHEEEPLVVEVQSERHHAALVDRASDAARRARLEAAEFVVVEVWDTAIWHDRHVVIAAVRDGLRAARIRARRTNLQLVGPLERSR